jgi:hypothetical protein
VLVVEGIKALKSLNGSMTNRQVAMPNAILEGSFVDGVAGGVGGAIGGGYLGTTAAENAVNALFGKENNEQQQKMLAFFVEYY